MVAMTSLHDYLTAVTRFVVANTVVDHRKVLQLWDQKEEEEEHSKQLHRRVFFFVSSYREDKSESV